MQSPPQGWYKQNSGTNSYLPTIWFVNKDTGWVSSVNDGLLGTTNGGDTWTIINSAPCYDVQFVDGKHGYVAINSGGLLKSADGGKTGEAITIPFGGKIKLFGMDTIYIFNGGNPSFTLSVDGGKTWFTTNSGLTHAQQGAMSFSDSKHGFLCGMAVLWFDPSPPPKGTNGAGFVITVDGGETWHNKYCSVQDGFHAIYATDEKHIYAAGGKGIYFSSDGGNTWQTLSNLGGFVDAFYFFNTRRGYTSGGYGRIYFTNDTGKTWELQNSTVASSLEGIIFIDSLTGWASGDSGAIVHTVDGGKSWVRQYLPTPFQLTTYPEPFATKTTVTYSIPKAAKVEIKVYDVMGKEVLHISSDGIQTEGSHSIEIPASGLSGGIYYFILTAGEFTGMGKITKIVM